jgi:adenylate cyclase
MAEDSVKRMLTAILCADVKGYSRMMGEDEEGTCKTFTVNLCSSIRCNISKHGDRVLQSGGFDSAFKSQGGTI